MGYYNEISAGYNMLHSEEQLAKAALIKKHADFRGLLLDIGAGTGLATVQFQGNAECIALDPAIEMLRQFPGMKVVGRAEQLPFKNASFDSVISITALHHSNIEQAKPEIGRVSKENAAIAVSFFKRAANFGKARGLFKGFREIDSEKDLIFVKQRIALKIKQPF
ncbi:MAG: methyltransferase domain-containing protein [Candidatus Diapherotrites archaeon]|uniref:Methyltransferase domain-containing protein n=1 Tax=Candidatus Iainarchaeum sp. TaxID=3101447 RepID=A0A938YVL8_9ARCH|nr:methyltransferase domain-containing protein [Candidatus Diapherotrites archaeon]